MENDYGYESRHMDFAFALAMKAGESGEVPIGCVIVKGGVVIGTGYNTCEGGKSALEHAEMKAIAMATRSIGGWRLQGCDLYVTLEPCFMCAGAIINSRISRVIFPLKDPRSGAFGSVANLISYPLNHKPEVIIAAEYAEKSRSILSHFFAIRRGV